MRHHHQLTMFEANLPQLDHPPETTMIQKKVDGRTTFSLSQPKNEFVKELILSR